MKIKRTDKCGWPRLITIVGTVPVDVYRALQRGEVVTVSNDAGEHLVSGGYCVPVPDSGEEGVGDGD